MGIKLKNNQKMLKIKYYLILVAVILLISCKSNAGIGIAKKEFIFAYKIVVFYSCVNAATSGNLGKFSLNNNDLGIEPQTAVLHHLDVLEAKNIGVELSKKIKFSYYYKGEKPIFSGCIGFAFSKTIDSMARTRYKNLRRGKAVYTPSKRK